MVISDKREKVKCFGFSDERSVVKSRVTHVCLITDLTSQGLPMFTVVGLLFIVSSSVKVQYTKIDAKLPIKAK